MFVIFSVFYTLIAASMIVLILLQRGSGADAGSGFGGGASATVFGARGSANFMTRATAILAALFFLLSLGMGIYLSRTSGQQDNSANLGVMAGLSKQSAAAQNTQPMTSSHSEVPNADGQQASKNDIPEAQPPKVASPNSSSPAKMN